MGSVGSSDWEEELRGNSCVSKGLKTPKKFSDEFIPVDYALVPRKLRSVKKRISGSVSPKLLSCKKLNREASGDDLSGKTALKKLKLSMERGISVRPGRQDFGSTMTKDEEEVAETLYALADMFPETGKDKTKLSGEQSKLESEAFSNMEMSESGVVLEKETEIRTISNAGTETDSQSSNFKVEIQSSSDGSWIKSLGKNSSVEFRAQEPKADLPSTVLNNNFKLLSTNNEPRYNAYFNKQGARFQVASKKPWKKCCTHVHIANLINEFKKSDTLLIQSTQPAHFEELNRKTSISSNTSTENTKDVFRLVSTSNAVSSAADTSSDEIRNAVLLHKRLLQDQQHTVSASQFFTLQNQNLDFFPLPAGGARGESSHGIVKDDQLPMTVPQLQLPYLHSTSQHTIPFLLPPKFYSTDSSTGRGTAVAQQVQLPSYLGGKSYAPPTGGLTASPKQQTWQQPQLRQNWCEQLTDHWKSGRIAAPNIPNWQNGAQDDQSLLQFAPFFSPSHSSLGVLGQNYALRQQPSTMPMLLLPPSREQGQPHLHYGFQGSVGRHPDSVQQALQLL